VNSMAVAGRNFFNPALFDERSVPSALPTSPAPYEETIVIKDIHQGGRDGKNDSHERPASRHSQDEDQQKFEVVHGVISHFEQSPLSPIDSKAPWQQDSRLGADGSPTSRLGEDRLMLMHSRGEKSTDPRVENLRGLPGEIEPLLPLFRLTQDAAQQRVSLQSSGRDGQSTAAEERTEIHITIGRVEVTALSPREEAKPTKQAASRRPPMSLDEYLVKRHGRAS
jgi:hypothetical protein